MVVNINALSFVSLTWGQLSLQGIITAPILFAIEEYPELRSIVDRGFDNPTNVDLVSVLSCRMGFGF